MAGSHIAEVNLVQYLVENHLLTPRDIVDGSLEIAALPGRNAVLRVTTCGGPSYIVKQFLDGRPAASHEAEAFSVLQESGDPLLSSTLPNLILHDDSTGTLVFDLEDAEDRLGDSSSNYIESTNFAKHIAQVLAALHSIPKSKIPTGFKSDSVHSHKHLLSITEEIFASASQASIDLISFAQADAELARALRELPTVAKSEAFIHGDLRWANFLVLDPIGLADGPHLRLVDWEMAGLGDPAWDVACFFAEKFSTWLSSIPKLIPSDTYKNFPSVNSYLDQIQRANRSFWNNYTSSLALNLTEQTILLDRAVRLIGARLVTRAVELDQISAVCSANAVTHLQVGAKILSEPTRSTRFLLGLADAWSTS